MLRKRVKDTASVDKTRIDSTYYQRMREGSWGILEVVGELDSCGAETKLMAVSLHSFHRLPSSMSQCSPTSHDLVCRATLPGACTVRKDVIWARPMRGQACAISALTSSPSPPPSVTLYPARGWGALAHGPSFPNLSTWPPFSFLLPPTPNRDTRRRLQFEARVRPLSLPSSLGGMARDHCESLSLPPVMLTHHAPTLRHSDRLFRHPRQRSH